MTNLLPLLLYFAGPFLLAAVWRRFGAEWSCFWIGMAMFALSQLIMVVLQGSLAAVVALATGLKAVERAMIVSVGPFAGLSEEPCRVLGFHWLAGREQPANWNRGIMYAIGHSGMEAIMVGGLMLAAGFLTKHFPDHVPAAIEGMASLTGLKAIVLAIHRLFGGLLIHAAFTSLVVLFMQGRGWWWLAAAIGLHAANNWVAVLLQDQLAEFENLALYTVAILVVYGIVLWWTRRLSLAATDESVDG